MDAAPNPDGAWEMGLSAYRGGRFFEAHEHWEDCWRALPLGDERTFVQGMIHAAVARYQHGRGNERGALSQYGKASRKLRGCVRGMEAPAVLEELRRALDLSV